MREQTSGTIPAAPAEPVPQVFSRPSTQKILGFVVCILWALLYSAVLSVLPVLCVAMALGGAGLPAGWMALAVFLAITAAVFWLNIQAYRRRAFWEFRLWPDRMEERAGSKVIVWPWETVEQYQASKFGHVPRIMLRSARRRIEMDGREWPGELRACMERLVVPAMGCRFQARLQAGEPVTFREPKGQTLVAVASMIVVVPVSVTIGVFRVLHSDPTMYVQVLFLPLTLIGSFLLARLYWRIMGGKGLIITARGFRAATDRASREIRWADAARVEVSADGLWLHRVDPPTEPLFLSVAAPNYAVLRHLLPGLLPEGTPIVEGKSAVACAGADGRA